MILWFLDLLQQQNLGGHVQSVACAKGLLLDALCSRMM